MTLPAKPTNKSVVYARLLCAAIEDRRLTRAALSVLLHLMDEYRPEKGYAAATENTIAAALGLSEATVGTAIKALRKYGSGGAYITRTKRGFNLKGEAGSYSYFVPRGFEGFKG